MAWQRSGGEPCLCCGQQLENKTAEEDFWLSPAPRHQPETIPGSVAGGGAGGVAVSLLSQSRRKILIVGLAGSSRQQQGQARI